MGSSEVEDRTGLDPDGIEWFRYPRIARHIRARAWLESEVLLGLDPNTIYAYGRGVDDFLAFCERVAVDPLTASRETILQYLGDLRRRPGPRGWNVIHAGSGSGLSNATM